MKTLEQLYLQHRGKVSETGSLDLAEYDRILAPYRDRPINLLVVGERNSGSLEIWSEFFRNANKLVGDEKLEAEQDVANHWERFDIVIDDGSRTSRDIVKSFLSYFPKLEDGGVFIVEDLQRSGDPDIVGDRYHTDSSIAFFKLLASIHSVEFVNSMCVVRKLPAAQNSSLGDRSIAGQDICRTEDVGLEEGIAGKARQISDLQQNVKGLERQILFLQDDVARRDASVAKLQRDMDAVLHSVSWRATAPLRWPGASLLRMRHLAGMVGRAVRASGGVKPMIRKVLSLYRREGIAGLRNGFRQRRDLSHESARRNDYDEWIQRYDRIDDEQRAAIRKRIAVMPDKPLISVVMPTYNPKPEWLKEAIESVRNQLYPNWELCIADDLSTDPAIRPLLEQMSGEDPRIKVIFREQNGHISAASNSALQLATGEWVALLDHDDLLPEHALYCVANAIVANPSARLIYSDEDKMDASGRRHDPYFKCDWNRDLFYSQNFFSHLGVYHKPLLDTVEGFRIGIEGSQDYDLVLRCIEHVDDDAIHHIPRVLYHWRVHAESTAGGADAKPYAALAGERALNEHFARRGVAASVEWVTRGYHTRYSLPATLPLVSLIIPTRNGLNLMRQCIDSIVGKTAYSNFEIIVVDNGSDDPEALRYFESLGQDARIRVLRDDRSFNYSALNNSAVTQAKGELVALINNDIEVISPEWLSEMVSLALQPGVGAVGAKLYYPDDTLQHGGVVLGIAGVAGHANKHAKAPAYGYFGRTCLIGSYSAVTAACMVVRKSIYQEVGGLNEKDLTIGFNDIDFCLRVREAGYRNVWTPYAELYHHESATRGDEVDPQRRVQFLTEIAYMQQRWGEVLSRDPAYSPNLTLDYEDFSLAWPPRVEGGKAAEKWIDEMLRDKSSDQAAR
jgi:glycosyltransferase involved in cell wall biosynthesis